MPKDMERTMPEKISNAQAAQLSKLAADTLRALSGENSTLRTENDELKQKVATFEKRARAEKIAADMEAKGLNSDVPFEAKVAEILRKENLEVIEEAVSMAAPQTKLASIHEDGVEVESTGDAAADSAAQRFAMQLASLD
jgi:regulator of replication initiation timing